MRKFATKDHIRIKTEKDGTYYACGIPYRFWNEKMKLPPSDLLSFKKKDKEIVISPAEQRRWMVKFKNKEIFQKPYLIGIGSLPSDEAALAMAFKIQKLAIDNNIRTFSFDVAGKEIPEEEDELIIAYNIHEDYSQGYRMRDIRDIISKNEDKFRIVVVAGNPGNFLCNQLRLTPNALFWFSEEVKRKTVL